MRILINYAIGANTKKEEQVREKKRICQFIAQHAKLKTNFRREIILYIHYIIINFHPKPQSDALQPVKSNSSNSKDSNFPFFPVFKIPFT
jgi:hypothetical protein